VRRLQGKAIGWGITRLVDAKTPSARVPALFSYPFLKGFKPVCKRTWKNYNRALSRCTLRQENCQSCFANIAVKSFNSPSKMAGGWRRLNDTGLKRDMERDEMRKTPVERRSVQAQFGLDQSCRGGVLSRCSLGSKVHSIALRHRRNYLHHHCALLSSKAIQQRPSWLSSRLLILCGLSSRP